MATAGDTELHALSPTEFEEFVADLYAADGWETTVTKGSGDRAADVLADRDDERLAIQCKRYSPGNKVSDGTIQKMPAAIQFHDADRAAVVTTSSFTANAYETAVKLDDDVELVNGETLRERAADAMPDDTTATQQIASDVPGVEPATVFTMIQWALAGQVFLFVDAAAPSFFPALTPTTAVVLFFITWVTTPALVFLHLLQLHRTGEYTVHLLGFVTLPFATFLFGPLGVLGYVVLYRNDR